jgi:glycerate kinase
MPTSRQRRNVEKIESHNPTVEQVTVLLAPDKFRGTATARELAVAMSDAVVAHGFAVDVQPLSDGGEGFVDAFGGTRVIVDVPGVLASTVSAPVVLVSTASAVLGVIDVASVVGRDLLPHPTAANALEASSEGVGFLIDAAVKLGAESIVVGCGGSSTSDGGLGCYLVLRDLGGLAVPVTVATDVTATFSGARRFAQQKGVAPDDLARIDERLRVVRERYLDEQGVDVELVEGSGAAGGIAGGLAALGARVTNGFTAVATEVGLQARIEHASLVITGEGRFDAGSLEGKVVVRVAAMAPPPTKVLVICGSVDRDAAATFRDQFPHVTVASLEDRFGLDEAVGNTLACVAQLVGEHLELLVQ